MINQSTTSVETVVGHRTSFDQPIHCVSMSNARGVEITPDMARKMKASKLKKLVTSGKDVPEHLLPTPITIASTPTPYPIKIGSFNKLFWQTSTNVKFDIYRLNPHVYPSTLCLIPTDLDIGGELNRLYVDQDLIELLLRPSMASASTSGSGLKKLNPIQKTSSSSTPLTNTTAALEPVTHDPAVLDKQSKLLCKFFEKKLQIRKAIAVNPALTKSGSSLAAITEGGESGEGASGANSTAAAASTDPPPLVLPPPEGTETTVAAADAKEEVAEVVSEFTVTLRGIQFTQEPIRNQYATSPQARAAIPKVS